jgi:hypothetical protein
MTSTGRGWFRDLSIETKMLAIILPLVAIPMIVLGSVGYVVSADQATTSGARYLKERASRGRYRDYCQSAFLIDLSCFE